MSQDATETADVLTFLKSLTVLYVEDSADVRDQLSQFLQRRFNRVLTAANGAEGLKLFTSESCYPDLVITDVRMPVMDGLTMTGQIKEHLQQNDLDVPVMVTTAHEETNFLLRAIDVGVDQFIIKPVDTKKLQASLLKIGRQLQSEHAVEQMRESLGNSEERYRTLFWTAMDAFCMFDWETMNIVEVNRRHQALYGYSQDQLAGKNLSLLFDNSSQGDIRTLIEETASLREPMIVSHQNSEALSFPVEMTIGQFAASGEGRSYGLIATRDARERLDNMEEQEAVVDALEITINALEDLLKP